MTPLRILFMGTPAFSVGVLDALLESKHEIIGVVTMPDKPAGRGQKVQKSAVKLFAEEKHLPVFQPENLKDPLFLEELKALRADVFFVVAFRFLPKEVWTIPPMGTINLHTSLLPDYRGAAPINWAIINGETKTGVTTFLIDKKIDTGALLMQEEITISHVENAGALYHKMMDTGAKLSIETLDGLSKNTLIPKPQEKHSNKEAPKIFTKDCQINWNNPLINIYNQVRGLSPYPGAYTFFNKNGKTLKVKILEGEIVLTKTGKEKPFLQVDKTGISITHPQGIYSIKELQIEGKKVLDSKSFINGLQQNDHWSLLIE